MDLQEGKTHGTSSPDSVSTKLRKVAKLAEGAPGMVFTTLAHHIDKSFLSEAFRQTRKDGATGIDGQTAEAYAENLDENLASLLSRFKTGTYKAPSVRRTYIPKGTSNETRPIGIPTLEDKVLQKAVTMVLESVYEQDFLDCSFGFRPKRSAHQGLEKLWRGLMQLGGGVVLDVDIRKFFDTLAPSHLRGFLDLRVKDGVIRRAIDKWLKAGVMEKGVVSYPKVGTPQGGVISPLLANIYLHEVLDKWFYQEVVPRLNGSAFLVRYCDDFVIVCSNEGDAHRVMKVLPKRFGRYDLSLHPAKTRLVRFNHPNKGGGSDTFDFLGFTHYWGKSRKGHPVVIRKTAKDRMARSLAKISQWCRENRHLPVKNQSRILTWKMRGHYGYFGITGNALALKRFHFHVKRIWRKWLNRRSQRARMTWDKFTHLLREYPLPKPIVVHSKLSCSARP